MMADADDDLEDNLDEKNNICLIDEGVYQIVIKFLRIYHSNL